MKLRVGIVDYLNSWPLAWAFLTGRLEGEFDARYLSPAGVADGLAAGDLDAGLVPAIELQRLPDLEVVPGLCIASTREVRSVLLISSAPIAAVRRLTLDLNSRTSAILVQILLRDRFGVAPELVTRDPREEDMLAGVDAALVIGDPALRVERGGLQVWDLAHEWRAMTGLPFVFAVWAVRRGVGRQGLTGVFAESLRLGRVEMDSLVERAVAELGLPAGEVREYLTRNLTFEMGPAERAGLEEYYRRARACGLLETVRPLAYQPTAGLPGERVEYRR